MNSSLEVLLRIEDSRAYAQHLAVPLLKSLLLTDPIKPAARSDLGFSEKQSEEIQKVEAVLRHLHICWHDRGTSSHARAIDDAYSYYLRLVVSEERSELRAYVKRFWPNIYQWGRRSESLFLIKRMLTLARREHCPWHPMTDRDDQIRVVAAPW